MRYRITAGGLLPLGMEVMVQNGFAYWLITGNCHFYVMSEPWSEVHEGDLERAEAQRIAATVRRGRRSEPFAGSERAFDAGSTLLETARDITPCPRESSPGDGGSADATGQSAVEYAYTLTDTLYERGTPVRGSIRISVVEFPATGVDFAPQILPIPWPLSTPLEEVSVDELNASHSAGALITNGSDIKVLREMRENRLSGEFGTQWASYNYFWIGDGPDSPRHELRFRDVIPLENANGNIQMEFDPSTLQADADGGA